MPPPLGSMLYLENPHPCYYYYTEKRSMKGKKSYKIHHKFYINILFWCSVCLRSKDGFWWKNYLNNKSTHLQQGGLKNTRGIIFLADGLYLWYCRLCTNPHLCPGGKGVRVFIDLCIIFLRLAAKDHEFSTVSWEQNLSKCINIKWLKHTSKNGFFTKLSSQIRKTIIPQAPKQKSENKKLMLWSDKTRSNALHHVTQTYYNMAKTAVQKCHTPPHSKQNTLLNQSCCSCVICEGRRRVLGGEWVGRGEGWQWTAAARPSSDGESFDWKKLSNI